MKPTEGGLEQLEAIRKLRDDEIRQSMAAEFAIARANALAAAAAQAQAQATAMSALNAMNALSPDGLSGLSAQVTQAQANGVLDGMVVVDNNSRRVSVSSVGSAGGLVIDSNGRISMGDGGGLMTIEEGEGEILEDEGLLEGEELLDLEDDEIAALERELA